MSGLADELLADIEGLSDAAEDDYEESKPTSGQVAGPGPNRQAEVDVDMSDLEDERVAEAGAHPEGMVGGLVLDGGVKPADELDAEEVQQMDLGGIEDVSSIAKLEGSKRMADILRVRTVGLCSGILLPRASGN